MTFEEILAQVQELLEAELLYQRSLPPQATYLFKHALIQDAGYQSLLKSTRQQYHTKIARVLAERFSETVETQPELLAHHYTEAGLIEQAVPYWQKAGEQATQRSAYVEAVAHLMKGLELLKTLAETPKRVQQELTLQLALNGALALVKGFTAPEVEKTVLRARELCQQLGETPQLFPVLVRLYGFYQNRGELQTTRELAEQMIQLAQSVQDLYLLSTAHAALGGTLYWLGELTSARTHLEQAIALYDPQHPRHTAGTTDLRVQGLYYASVTLWHLGYPDQALKRSHEAVAVAAGLSLPFSLAQALGFAAAFHSFRREWQIARERAEAVITLSTEQGFPFWLAQGTIVRGMALVEQEQMEEGIAQTQQGLAAFRAMGAELVRTAHLPRLAAAYAKVGQVEEGLRVVAEALAAVDQTGERFSEAELYRLKGQLTLQKFQASGSKFQVTNPQHPAPSTQAEVEAEACFFKAIEIARRQSAKSWKLRAVMSLSRLWQRQGKKDEARRMLAEIYGWFTEGFDTKDLQEAKKLLEELI
jgi:predicted ATPase